MKLFNQAMYYYRNTIFNNYGVGEEILVVGNLAGVHSPLDLDGNRIPNEYYKLHVIYDVDQDNLPLMENFLIDDSLFNAMNITPNTGITMTVIPIKKGDYYASYKVKNIISQSEELCIPMAQCNICGKFLGYINMNYFNSFSNCACDYCSKFLNIKPGICTEYDSSQSSVTPIYYIPKSYRNTDVGSDYQGIRANRFNFAEGLDIDGYISNKNIDMMQNNVYDDLDPSKPFKFTVRLEDFEEAGMEEK